MKRLQKAISVRSAMFSTVFYKYSTPKRAPAKLGGRVSWEDWPDVLHLSPKIVAKGPGCK